MTSNAETAHLPFERTFPSTYQEWLTKGDLAEGYRRWAKNYDIVSPLKYFINTPGRPAWWSWRKLTSSQNISLSTTLVSGSWLAEKDIWDLKISRHGRQSHITSSFVVFAVGGGAQFPVSPTYEDRVCL